jgi:hypothetical protein
MAVATSLVSGYLTSVDWSTFNGKQSLLTNSAGLAAALNDETGSGFAVFATSPTLTTPVINGTITGTTVIPVANGGTGQSGALVAGGVLYGSTTTAMGVTAIGTAGQVLRSNGAAAPSWQNAGAGDMILANAQTVSGVKTFSALPVFSTLTIGSIPFIGVGKALDEDNANLFWNNATKWLGIGTSTPTAPLDVVGNVHISATGSGRSDVGSPNPPREIGITNWVDGNGARITFGDAWNTLQNAYGYRMQIVAYHGVDISGSREDPTPLGFVQGSGNDASLNVIGTVNNNPVLTVSAPAGQSVNMQEWKKGGTVLASVTSAGLLSATTGLTASGADVNLNASSTFNTNINTGTSTGAVTIGSSTNDGVRFGNGRITINKPTPPITGQTGDLTPTVSQILDAGIFGFNSGTGRTLTIPTASGAGGLVQALPGTPVVGDIFTFMVYNDSNGSVTLQPADASVTVVTNIVNLNDRLRIVNCRVTGITAGSETISVY